MRTPKDGSSQLCYLLELAKKDQDPVNDLRSAGWIEYTGSGRDGRTGFAGGSMVADGES